MSTIADLVIKISADAGAAEKQIAAAGGKIGGGFKKAIIPAAASLALLGVAGKVAFGNLMDGAKNAAQTNAVIHSTGGAANVTAKHVDDLAMSLRRKAGVDDDVVHSGENMLLTFTNVQNSVGKGNNIFDQATKTMLDMSVALGQDTKSSAIQLGKALNDPIKGVTALQRVGVSFTAAQKKQIKTLVEHGHTMQAQKLILHELNKEFGGSATKIDPMQKSINNLKLDMTDMASSIVAGLLPAFQTLIGLLGRGAAFLQQHATATKVLGLVIAGLATVVLLAAGAMKVYEAGAAVVRAATAAWAAVQWLLNTAFMGFPLVFIVAAIVALIAIFVLAWTHSQTFRNIVTAAWNGIKAITLTVFNFIRDHIRTVMLVLLTIMTGGLALIVALVITHWNQVKAITSSVWNAIKAVVSAVIGAIRTVVSTGFSLLSGIVSTTLNAVKTTVSTVWNGIKSVVTTAVDGIKTAVRTGFGVLSSIIHGVAGAIRGAVSAITSALHPIISVLQTIVDMAGKVSSALSSIKGAAGAVGKVGGGLLGHVPGFATGVQNFRGGLAVVGERGPELVNLPRGADVFTNSESARMARGDAARTAPLFGEVHVSNEVDIEVLAQRVARVLAFSN